MPSALQRLPVPKAMSEVTGPCFSLFQKSYQPHPGGEEGGGIQEAQETVNPSASVQNWHRGQQPAYLARDLALGTPGPKGFLRSDPKGMLDSATKGSILLL